MRSNIDVTKMRWKAPDWSRNTLTVKLLIGGGIAWYDDDAGEWYLDPRGSVPELLRVEHRKSEPRP